MLKVRRLIDRPIIGPELFRSRGGDNINGPSLIHAPDWLPNRHGKFYLYFAHHHGQSIRLAYADRLEGPWKLHEGGTLQLRDAVGCHDHIASPDVHVDDGQKEIRMYFHGVVKGGREQRTFLATSRDGISFQTDDRQLADFYLRVVRWRERWVGMAKGGTMYLSDSHAAFSRLPGSAFVMKSTLGNTTGDVRHVALKVTGDSLAVYFTQIGDMPEQIRRATVDLTQATQHWRANNFETVIAPERPWEGAALPLVPSKAGAARQPENALRDPAIFDWEGKTYLLYSAAGENSIGIGEILG